MYINKKKSLHTYKDSFFYSIQLLESYMKHIHNIVFNHLEPGEFLEEL